MQETDFERRRRVSELFRGVHARRGSRIEKARIIHSSDIEKLGKEKQRQKEVDCDFCNFRHEVI